MRSETVKTLQSYYRKEQKLSKKTGKTCEAEQNRKILTILRTRCIKKSQGYGRKIMKKIFVILVALIGFGLSTFAGNGQPCSVAGGGTVSAEVISWSDSGNSRTFIIQLSNSSISPVNAQFELKATNANGTYGTFYTKGSGSKLVKPGDGSDNRKEIIVPINGLPNTQAGYKVDVTGCR